MGQTEVSTGDTKNEKIRVTKDRLYSEQRGRVLRKEETLSGKCSKTDKAERSRRWPLALAQATEWKEAKDQRCTYRQAKWPCGKQTDSSYPHRKGPNAVHHG